MQDVHFHVKIFKFYTLLSLSKINNYLGWDEPAFKASFKITITRHKSYNSLSNNPLLKTEKFEE
jgi:hypothetical protein